jgi:PAS domain S-box-containing protein
LETELSKKNTPDLSNNQYSVFECSKDPVVMSDTKGKVSYFNTAAEELYGYKKSEILGKPVTILYRDPSMAKKVLKLMRKGSGMLRAIELEALNKQKEVIPVLLSSVILKNRSGDEIQIAGISSDLRQIKYLSSKLSECQNSNLSIRDLYTRLHLAKESIQGLEYLINAAQTDSNINNLSPLQITQFYKKTFSFP